ncbi:unnamed protein product [Linum trigynum]|uniref:FAD-binding PCMH-type domain-containing protein n=1 Tax=Linum trigynum TaxID=586398 RepID=A0AAV2FYQ1_9ROSI
MPSVLLVLVLQLWAPTWAAGNQDFVQCVHDHYSSKTSTAPSISELIYTPGDASYTSVLQSSIMNPRFNDTSTIHKPLAIFIPQYDSHVQAAVLCCRKHELPLRIRSGGHDLEGLSYLSVFPSNDDFVMIDLTKLRAVHDVNLETRTAWVQSGATLGELYYAISQKSRVLAFPAGFWPTVGVGGHFSGGGSGALSRKFGLAADNVIDAILIDAEGRVLDRASMGEDLFWAIRGGGGNTFGVVTAWKINLLPVPPSVTVFNLTRAVEENASELVHRWQYAADKLPEEVSSFLVSISSKTASFQGLYLGEIKTLLPLFEEKFPELGLSEGDCSEMSWIDSVLFFLGSEPVETLLRRTGEPARKVKSKSDFVQEPLPEDAVDGIWRILAEVGPGEGVLQLEAHGGKMSEVPEFSIPYPHRAGNVYMIQYYAYWDGNGVETEERHLDWIRRLEGYLAPFVSQGPRGG